jgi:anti-sigma regulatory factor (Ser/Thr protein kinase)
VPGSWSLQTCLELGALPSAVGCGRLHVKLVLREWGLPAFSDSVELIVSELLTNAIRASVNYAQSHEVSPRLPSVTPVCLRLASDRQRVLIEVWDSDPRPPRCITPDPDAENGRGLFLVEILSSRWNWYFPEGWNGKVVWAEIPAQ